MRHCGGSNATPADFPGQPVARRNCRWSELSTAPQRTSRPVAARQAVQKGVAAATPNDINPPKFLSCDAREAAHDFSIPGGQTMENEAGHLWRGLRALCQRRQSPPLELSIDTGRHFSGQQQVRVVHIQQSWRGGRCSAALMSSGTVQSISAAHSVMHCRKSHMPLTFLWKQMRPPTAPRLVKSAACASGPLTGS